MTGAFSLTTAERNELQEHLGDVANELRQLTLSLGGIVEHHSACDCGESDPAHDALVIGVPQPYLTHYRRHWPAFRALIDAEFALTHAKENPEHDPSLSN